MHPPMVNGGTNYGQASMGQPAAVDRNRQPPPPGHLDESAPAENSNRHQMMNNRLKTLIQNRQNQKEMVQGVQSTGPLPPPAGPMLPQYSPMPPTPSNHSQSFSSTNF